MGEPPGSGLQDGVEAADDRDATGAVPGKDERDLDALAAFDGRSLDHFVLLGFELTEQVAPAGREQVQHDNRAKARASVLNRRYEALASRRTGRPHAVTSRAGRRGSPPGTAPGSWPAAGRAYWSPGRRSRRRRRRPPTGRRVTPPAVPEPRWWARCRERHCRERHCRERHCRERHWAARRSPAAPVPRGLPPAPTRARSRPRTTRPPAPPPAGACPTGRAGPAPAASPAPAAVLAVGLFAGGIALGSVLAASSASP